MSVRQAIIISAAKNGHINQCKALCHAMGWQVLDTLTLPGTARYHSPVKKLKIWGEQPKAIAVIMEKLGRLPPAHLVFSGQASRLIAERLKGSFGARIFVGIPKGKRRLFDYAVCFSHEATGNQYGRPDAYTAAQHTLWMKGVPCLPVLASMRDSTTAVLIGGRNNAFTLDADRIAGQIAFLQSSGGSLAIAVSRRTPPGIEKDLRKRFTGTTFVSRDDRDGFLRLLSTADRFAITPDSITMACECCITGRPVALLEAPAHDTENATYRFVSEFLADGYVTSLADIQSGKTWRHGKPWNETERLSHELTRLLGQD